MFRARLLQRSFLILAALIGLGFLFWRDARIAQLKGRETEVSTATTEYPLHTNVTATVFWVGEPAGSGSSEDNAVSAYDDSWQTHFGCFDDPWYRRVAENDYFPTHCTPKENPFYLDLPVDDMNTDNNSDNRPTIRKIRTAVIPWAKGRNDPGDSYSFLKNRWVRIIKGDRTCYGQIEDAGPYVYDDIAYVFGDTDRRPASLEANNAGMDVSPSLRDCLGFDGLNNDENKVDWQFVEENDVPEGPWKKIVTTRGVFQP